MPKIYPETATQNRTICVVGRGEAKDFSTLMCNSITEYKTLYNSKVFPLYLYEKSEDQQVDTSDLFFNSNYLPF